MPTIFISSRASTASRRAGRVGIPACSMNTCWVAAVPPCMPSIYDYVGAALDGELDVIENARSSHLNVDRDLPVGDLAQLGDFDSQVIATRPVRMPARRALVDTLGQSSHRGDSLADFLPQQNASAARLGALPNYDFDRVGFPQIVGVESVARGQTLIDQGL